MRYAVVLYTLFWRKTYLSDSHKVWFTKDHVRTIASCYIISHCQPISVSSAIYTSEPFVYCCHDAAFRNVKNEFFSPLVNVMSLIKETGPTLITVIRPQLNTLSPMSRSRFWRHIYPQYGALNANDRFYLKGRATDHNDSPK